jgi:hypothetical protein
MVSAVPKEDSREPARGCLESLIEDDGEDDYLNKHYELEEQHSKATKKNRVNKRID